MEKYVSILAKCPLFKNIENQQLLSMLQCLKLFSRKEIQPLISELFFPVRRRLPKSIIMEIEVLLLPSIPPRYLENLSLVPMYLLYR